MMNRAQAEAYGKKIGVKYLVKDNHGTLYGGFKDRKAAEDCKKEWDKDNKTNPWMDEVPAIYIEEVQA